MILELDGRLLASNSHNADMPENMKVRRDLPLKRTLKKPNLVRNVWVTAAGGRASPVQWV